MLTLAPTVQIFSMRNLLCLCAMNKNLAFFTRGISQTYVQSETIVQRLIFVWTPTSMDLSPQTLLRVNRPIYGLPEAEVHWFQTYHDHHCAVLQLQLFIVGPCFLYTAQRFLDDITKTATSRGFICLQTDDTANVGNSRFAQIEASMSQKFGCKAPVFLTQNRPINFNGTAVTKHDNSHLFFAAVAFFKTSGHLLQKNWQRCLHFRACQKSLYRGSLATRYDIRVHCLFPIHQFRWKCHKMPEHNNSLSKGQTRFSDEDC